MAARQKNVRAAFANQLTVVADFLTGSYRRQTLIGPLKYAYVDIIVIMAPEGTPVTPWSGTRTSYADLRV